LIKKTRNFKYYTVALLDQSEFKLVDMLIIKNKSLPWQPWKDPLKTRVIFTQE